VYGDPLEHPQTEAYWGNVNPIGERSCYDEGKRAAECLTMDYHREHGLEVGGSVARGSMARVGARSPCARSALDTHLTSTPLLLFPPSPPGAHCAHI
jgi:hypothetical protein